MYIYSGKIHRDRLGPISTATLSTRSLRTVTLFGPVAVAAPQPLACSSTPGEYPAPRNASLDKYVSVLLSLDTIWSSVLYSELLSVPQYRRVCFAVDSVIYAGVGLNGEDMGMHRCGTPNLPLEVQGKYPGCRC